MRISYHLLRLPGSAGSLRRALAAALLLLCSAPVLAQELDIVVSIAPYADLVERVAGDRASVTTLLPAGASPHSFDPSPSQAATLARADLVVMNGGLDAWLERLVAATAPHTSLLVIMREIDVPHVGTDADEHDHGSAVGNPHVWLDPQLAIAAVEAIAERLAALDPAHAERYRANAGEAGAEIRALDARLAELLAPVAGAPFVPFHDAWVYFAARYRLNLVVTLEPFPGRQPSPRYVAEAVRAVRDSGARAIFAERQLGTRSAEVVAESAGVEVAVIDPIGGEPGPVTYEELLLVNAQVILDALKPERTP